MSLTRTFVFILNKLFWWYKNSARKGQNWRFSITIYNRVDNFDLEMKFWLDRDEFWGRVANYLLERKKNTIPKSMLKKKFCSKIKNFTRSGLDVALKSLPDTTVHFSSSMMRLRKCCKINGHVGDIKYLSRSCFFLFTFPIISSPISHYFNIVNLKTDYFDE